MERSWNNIKLEILIRKRYSPLRKIMIHHMHLLLISIFSGFCTICLGQSKNIIGTFTNGIAIPNLQLTFNADSTFQYSSKEHPTFYRWEEFSEKGVWTISKDTITLNSQLSLKPFVQSDFQEEKIKGDSGLLLTFNHIKRYYDIEGNLIKKDTVQ